MAYRLIKRYPRSIYKGSKEVKQHFNYLLVIDFESTCKKYEKMEPQEIIEFPCAAVSTKTWNTENVFHEYIKPKVHPQLTSFCTDLTGIIQDMVDNQPHFPEVFDKFCKWLEKHNYFKEGNDCAFVTCGDWDLKSMLPAQCELDNIPLPDHFQKWINIKDTFCEATQYYPRSLKDMLTFLKIPLQGRLHCGINDVENIVKVIQTLQAQHNVEFKINTAPNLLKKNNLKTMFIEN